MRYQLNWVWVFALLNYLYCDVLGLMDKGILVQFLSGNVDGMDISQMFLFTAGLLMEIPIAMILVNAFARARLARVLNMGAGALMTIVQMGSLFLGSSTYYYRFFSFVEILATIAIVYIAYTWRVGVPEGGRSENA